MSKTKTLFAMALVALLGSMGAAQAQNVLYEVKLFTTPAAAARAGGEDEMSGGVLLNFTPNVTNALTVTLDYSVPLAGDIDSGSVSPGEEGLTTSLGTTLVGSAENDDNDGNGTITITSIANGANLLIRGVMLDVSDASETVTVTVKVASSNLTDFIRIDGPSSATVIEDILVGVTATPDPQVVRTRGTGMEGITASLTLKESFKGAFMMGNMLEIQSSGIPEGAALAAAVTNNPKAADFADGDFAASSYAVAKVKDGVVTVRLGGMDMVGEGVDNVDNNMARSAPAKVELALTLTAKPDNDDISFPLDVDSIMVKVTFTGDDADEEGSFTDAFTDYVTVFNIRPAQCEILFPVVTVRPDVMFNTAISVTNPAYGDEMASGGLMFTFYGMGDVVGMYDTTVDPIVGVGLEADGTLSPGGTYQVLASEILAATNWGETFQGHVHLRADYTHCSGLGWVTDFTKVNQAYSAVVIDADTGTGTAE